MADRLRKARLTARGNRERWPVMYPAWVAAIAGVLGAAMGGGITAYTSDKLLDSQIEMQMSQFKESRAASERDLRTKAYAQFLEAFDLFNRDAGPYSVCSLMDTVVAARSNECKAALASQPERLLGLRKAETQVALYGSGEANDIVQGYLRSISIGSLEHISELELEVSKLRQILEAEIGGTGQSNISDATPSSGRVGIGSRARLAGKQLTDAERRLAKARESRTGAVDPAAGDVVGVRQQLQTTMCREINPNPRPSC